MYFQPIGSPVRTPFRWTDHVALIRAWRPVLRRCQGSSITFDLHLPQKVALRLLNAPCPVFKCAQGARHGRRYFQPIGSPVRTQPFRWTDHVVLRAWRLDLQRCQGSAITFHLHLPQKVALRLLNAPCPVFKCAQGVSLISLLEPTVLLARQALSFDEKPCRELRPCKMHHVHAIGGLVVATWRTRLACAGQRVLLRCAGI